MSLTTFRDLRVVIGEDEQLLAFDLAQQLEALGARVVASAGTVEQLEGLIQSGLDETNAAILDVDLLDGSIFPLVPDLEQRGVAVVFCTGYHRQDCPAELAHIPWIGKPARAADIAITLCLAIDARRNLQID